MSETSAQPPASPRDAEGTSDWKYKNVPIMDDVENLENYGPGGLAPLNIGDNLANDRFQIIYKLGFGGIATVWLCWEVATEKWRAIKVNAARYSANDCPDLMAIQHMKDQGVSWEELEANHIIMPLETFWEETPNGRHLCSVLPVLGPRLTDWRSDALGTDTDRIDSLCYQVAEGLSFLHSKALCHGDFRPQNILMKLKPGSLDHLSRDDMWELLGNPATADVWTVNGDRSIHAPEEVVTEAPWQCFQDFVTDSIAIVDFGEAYRPNEPLGEFGIPPTYASPEVLFRKGRVGPKSDVWSLATTLLEVRLDRYGINSPDGAIRQMERFIGPVPHYYRSEAQEILIENGWEGLDTKSQASGPEPGSLQALTSPLDAPINDDEERDAKESDYLHPLEMRLGTKQRAWGFEPDPDDPTGVNQRWARLYYYLSRDEVMDFSDLLKKMFQYEPENRISASQVLTHRWFRKQHHLKKGRLPSPKYCWITPVLIAGLASVIWLVYSASQQAMLYDPTKDQDARSFSGACRAIVLYFHG